MYFSAQYNAIEGAIYILVYHIYFPILPENSYGAWCFAISKFAFRSSWGTWYTPERNMGPNLWVFCPTFMSVWFRIFYFNCFFFFFGYLQTTEQTVSTFAEYILKYITSKNGLRLKFLWSVFTVDSVNYKSAHGSILHVW